MVRRPGEACFASPGAGPVADEQKRVTHASGLRRNSPKPADGFLSRLCCPTGGLPSRRGHLDDASARSSGQTRLVNLAQRLHCPRPKKARQPAASPGVNGRPLFGSSTCCVSRKRMGWRVFPPALARTGGSRRGLSPSTLWPVDCGPGGCCPGQSMRGRWESGNQNRHKPGVTRACVDEQPKTAT